MCIYRPIQCIYVCGVLGGENNLGARLENNVERYDYTLYLVKGMGEIIVLLYDRAPLYWLN